MAPEHRWTSDASEEMATVVSRLEWIRRRGKAGLCFGEKSLRVRFHFADSDAGLFEREDKWCVSGFGG